MAEPEQVASLQSLVARHCVRWEAHRHYRAGERGKPVAVGFELVLLGTHDHPTHPPEPGCGECVEVFAALRRVARWVVPAERRPTVCQILPFDDALLFPSPGHGHLDVALKIWLLHRARTTEPVDDCERQCLAEIESKLDHLGARRES